MAKVYKVPGISPTPISRTLIQEQQHVESMVLLQELKANQDKIVELKNRNRVLKRMLGKHNGIPKKYLAKPIHLYALRLEHGCYYVGMSRDPERRFKKHGGHKGAMWTKLHKPIEIIEVRKTGLTDDSEVASLEDQMTIEYARRYGTDVVRGGGYCQTYPRWPQEALEPDLAWIA